MPKDDKNVDNVFRRVLVVEESDASDVRITMFGVKRRDEMTTGIGMIVGGLLRAVSEAGAEVHAYGFDEENIN